MTPLRLDAALDALPWAHLTPCCRALGFDFAVRVMDPALGAYLDDILQPFHDRGNPQRLYSLVDRGPGRAGRRYAVYLDGRRLARSDRPSTALSWLLWHVNRSVIQSTPHHLLVHASGVEWSGVGVILPAPMESGKTTLAAGLVRAGLRYVTDEATAIDPATLELVPYPKPLSVDRGSWEVLADLRPTVAADVAPYLSQWHVNPCSIRPGAIAPRCRAGFVITPRYRQGIETRLDPLGRSQALAALAENALNLRGHGRRGLGTLAEVVRDCRCFRLAVGDLDEACRIVVELLAPDRLSAA